MSSKKITNHLSVEDVDPILSSFEESGYMVEFLHIGSGKMCMFPAWITDFSETYSSDWNSETVFGRSDAIGVYRGTKRKINLSLTIPSWSAKEAHHNMHQLEHLIALTYPSYKNFGGTQQMSAQPLVKVWWSNLIRNADASIEELGVNHAGLACWMDSVSVNFDMNSGFHHPSPVMSDEDLQNYNYKGSKKASLNKNNRSHFLVPKTITFSVGLNIVHEHKLGWNGVNWAANDNDAFPYGMITLSGKEHHTNQRKGGGLTYRTGAPVTKAGTITGEKSEKARDAAADKARKQALKGIFESTKLGQTRKGY